MDTNKFWERVKAHMKAHKISQKRFAEYIEVPLSTFYSWFKYNRSVEVGTAYNIAVALGVSLEYLITGHNGKDAEERMMEIENRKSAGAEIKKLIRKLEKQAVKL